MRLAAQARRPVATPCALAVHAYPMAEAAEGPLHDLAPLQHEEAVLIRFPLDDTMAHVVDVTPFLTTLGCEGVVEDGQAQAGPVLLAVIEDGHGVTILHVGP